MTKRINKLEIAKEYKTTRQVLQLKRRKLQPKGNMRSKKLFRAYNPQSTSCSLRLNEKLEMLEERENNLLNKKSEVISKCRHQNKYMLQALGSRFQFHDVTYLYTAIFNVMILNKVRR